MDKRVRQRICLLLLFGLMLLLGTACGSGTSQDTKPSGEPTKIAEATKPVEPTNTSTPIPTAEPTKPVELQPVEKLTLRIEGEICEEKLDKGLKEYEDTGVDITVAVDFGNVPPEEAKKAFLEQYPSQRTRSPQCSKQVQLYIPFLADDPSALTAYPQAAN